MRHEPFEPPAAKNAAREAALRWYVCDAPWPADALAAVAALAGPDEVAWLDSAAAAQPGHEQQYSMICTAPLMVLEQHDGCAATLKAGRRLLARDRNGWDLWRRTLRKLPALELPICEPPVGGACSSGWRESYESDAGAIIECGQSSSLPGTANSTTGSYALGLTPGWVGYIGFEMAHFLERLPSSHREELGLPLMRLALFDRAIVLDHAAHHAYAIAAPAVRATLDLGPDDFSEWLQQWQAAASASAFTVRRPAARPEVRFESSRVAHVRAVERALEYIAAGDIYQVNLAHRLSLRGLDPLSAYAAIRTSNPAPYAALLRWSDGTIASASPELFLRLRGDAVLTRPIKGTRPRGACAADNERRRRELLASDKEAAELAMIIDLHRNDLGRVCAFGSVQVQAARRLEMHPSVFHTVADVTGRLAPGRDALDLLHACFPAGSVTGVPKIRAMQIIDELEPAARGAYTGAVGVLSLDGQMNFNVAIRTLQMRGERALLHVGGGIVADSDPQAEYEETLAKARGILDGLLNRAPQKRRMATHAARSGLH